MTKFNDLVEGYRRFRDSGWTRERERWAELAEGQSPKVMVIACSDSRVDPAQIF
ncbi:MAG TPA: carbonic anhydrase, partial [Allosphingosinicella sp.]